MLERSVMSWPSPKLTSPTSATNKPKQSRSRTAAEEALDHDANYTEDKGDFEIPTEDEPEEPGEEDTEPIWF